MTNKRLVVVQGPTGVGKTAVGIALARHFNAPILSADSRQCYREMRIGTAVPTDDELAAARHHFIQDRSIHAPLSAGGYEQEALALLERLFSEHDRVLVVGGSGLYVQALLQGFDPLPEADPALREKLAERPLSGLLEELERLDPVYFARVDRNNPQRVIRALEVCRSSGQPYSALRQNEAKERPFQTVMIGLERSRDELYRRIDRRVDEMVADGLVEEARTLYPHRHLNPLQTVGYQEFFDHFEGKTTLDEAVALVQRNSRRYAKRQLTWLRRDPSIAWFAPEPIEAIIAYVESYGHH